MIFDEKNKTTAGANERTPSRAQYFSWINSTNEGSTEAQTLANLAYFEYMYKKYGMQLEIYAWDAGNLDGSLETFQFMDSPKIKAQYPNGYRTIADAAAKFGCRMGVWMGPGGYGNTPEEAAARQEQVVALCRDYNFAQFKFDGVCGPLYEKDREVFVETMKKCREYCPDLITLNHRQYFGEEGMKYSTTFLWGGEYVAGADETYTDVHIGNNMTAPHHRGYFASRGNTPDLRRLAEDHGVCISSYIDYFEDELIVQAFGRCLILAPEIYGNPWFMRDDEHAHLARIYNLHRRYRDILVTGMLMPKGDYYPAGTVVRGSADRRFITTGNTSWNERALHIHLDMEIGLAPCDKVTVILHHPFEKYVGEFSYGDTVEVPVEPFRAALIEVCDSRIADTMLMGCEYEVIHETEDGRPDLIKIVSADGEVKFTDGTALDIDIPEFDNTLRAPILLGESGKDSFADVPADVEHQLEVTFFAQDHDSLEAQSIKRSGETAIPEVQAARDAFFNQDTYKLRGCEARFAFDGKDDTYFDGLSKTFFYGQMRLDGGCLRVDFGKEYDADYVMIEFFDLDETLIRPYKVPAWITWGIPPFRLDPQEIPAKCDYSADLREWKDSYLDEIKNLYSCTQDVLVHDVHNIIQVDGRRRAVYYPVKEAIRYFRMAKPLDRIFKIALIKDGCEIALECPTANNLLPYKADVKFAKEVSVRVEESDFRDGCYLAVGLEGEHGHEGAYVVLECDGKFIGCPERAPSFGSNIWECWVHFAREMPKNHTFYFDVTPEMAGKDITVRVLGVDGEHRDYGVSVHLCDKNRELDGFIAEI